MPSLANCTRCQRMFQRMYSPMCPECHQKYMSKFSDVYRFVQEHPHLTLEDIATQCNMPFRDVEDLFFQGKLGTASNHIIYHCQHCSRPINLAMRKGRFCTSCAEQFENKKASSNDPEKELSEKPLKTESKAVKSDSGTRPLVELSDEKTKSPAPAVSTDSPTSPKTESYGFKRVSSDS